MTVSHDGLVHLVVSQYDSVWTRCGGRFEKRLLARERVAPPAAGHWVDPDLGWFDVSDDPERLVSCLDCLTARRSR